MNENTPERTRDSLIAWAFLLYSFLILGSMATMSIGVALVVASVMQMPGGLSELMRISRTPVMRRYLWISFALAMGCAVTLLVSQWNPRGFNGEVREFSFFSEYAKAWYLALPVIVALGLSRLSASRRRSVLSVWLVTLGVMSAIGIAQYFTGWPRMQPIPENSGRFHATLFLGHHLSAASILIFPFFVALDLSVSSRRESVVAIPRLGLIAISLLAFIALLLGYSRTLWVALPVGIVAWLFFALSRRWKLAAIAGMAALLAIATQLPPIQARIQSGIGIGPRQELWIANWEIFQRWPVAGAGWLQNSEVAGMLLREKFPGEEVFGSHAHNNFLHMLGGTGLLGTLPWLVWCVWVVVLVYRHRDRIPFARGLLCAWLVFHLNGLTQVNFWEGKVLHQMMWMVGWSLALAMEDRWRRQNP